MENANIFWTLFFLITASGPSLTAVVREDENSCSPGEVRCADGVCVGADRVCDGVADCVDRKDEALCGGVSTVLSLWNPDHQRSKRQASKCRKNQWQCRDTTCISFDGKCDGIVDCPDGSDESFPLCRKEKCQYNWFRCTYGACVDGTAPCNGVQECADNSDELLPRCRNETDEIQGRFRCSNGETIPAANHCDGVVDCTDGSDETVRACAAKTCPSYLFQCAYGACVDDGSDCNNIQDCADNSDESDELCNRISAVTTTTAPSPNDHCILPAYPAHGGYTVQGAPLAVPGQVFKTVTLMVTCNTGYSLKGSESVLCFNGFWVSSLPKCIRSCKLPKHPGVEYRCLLRDDNGLEGSKPCREYEPTGTVVQPLCKAPNYYAAGTLGFMRCIEDSWDYIAICSPGLANNGTNVTILIKDKVEVHISQFQYTSPVRPEAAARPTTTAPVWAELTTAKPSWTGQTQAVKPSVAESTDYDIDDADWRMGVTTNKFNGTVSKVGVLVKNTTVVVDLENGVVHFKND